MNLCPNCRIQLKRHPGGLLTCSVCGFSFKPKQSTPLLPGYQPKTQVAVQNNSPDRELQIFIRRVAQKLLPLYNDYDIKAKNAIMKNRAQIEKELTTVLDGKEPYDKWFNRTRRNYGKHTIDMTKILYDSLEGLRSKEAQEMRAQYEQALQTVQSQYSAGAGVGLGGPQA